MTVVVTCPWLGVRWWWAAGCCDSFRADRADSPAGTVPSSSVVSHHSARKKGGPSEQVTWEKRGIFLIQNPKSGYGFGNNRVNNTEKSQTDANLSRDPDPPPSRQRVLRPRKLRGRPEDAQNGGISLKSKNNKRPRGKIAIKKSRNGRGSCEASRSRTRLCVCQRGWEKEHSVEPRVLNGVLKPNKIDRKCPQIRDLSENLGKK